MRMRRLPILACVVFATVLPCCLQPTVDELTERAYTGDAKAMAALARSYYDRGDQENGAHWLFEAALKGDKVSFATLKAQADGGEASSMMRMADYYGKIGEKRLHFDYYYRFAKVEESGDSALTIAILFLFGDVNILGTAPTLEDHAKGLECLILGAKAETRTRWPYLLLAQLLKDHRIVAPSPQDGDEWNAEAAKATSRDRRLLVQTLEALDCPAAAEYAKTITQ